MGRWLSMLIWIFIEYKCKILILLMVLFGLLRLERCFNSILPLLCSLTIFVLICTMSSLYLRFDHNIPPPVYKASAGKREAVLK